MCLWCDGARPVSPFFADVAEAEAVSLLAQTNEVHLGLQGHQEGAAVGNVQIEPQT